MRKSWPYAVVMLLVLVGVPRLLRHFIPDRRLALTMFPVVMFALLVPIALYFLPRYRRSQKLTDEGLQLLSEGRVAAALERFEASRPLAKVQVIPTYNIGIARLQLWQLPVAGRELSSLESRKDLTPQFRAVLSAALALVDALEGRLARVEPRLAEARSRVDFPLWFAPLASAVVACREGRWAEARELLADAALENLNGPLRGLRNVLDVWCVEQITGEARPVDAIALFGEASQDSLEAAWPELVNYVVKRSS
ncbi:hypothetical protein HJC10_26250 [Corallococcus exiguus]|uniref:hypothetical protein n=1 Tax=Corallococcus exiguus TaxID=83462 RepID=UPI001470C4DA|nr:hypothetical protein [Corallococcus exiguus]NNB91164.1 hypothetical protein [Corallococcus exiguus]NNB93490.1 hypothetical protein [Corallococcus exiguus]NNC06339.1 hypothetical protein [Corallococcus exiguus]